MPARQLPHLHHEKTRHDRLVRYVRIGHGPRIRLKATHGSKEFYAEYQSTLAGQPMHKPVKGASGTLAWAIHQFMESPRWRRLAAESRKQLGYQLKRLGENAGDKRLSDITKRMVIDGRDRRDAKPSDANKYVLTVKMLFEFAIEHEWVETNPAAAISKPATSETGEGFHTWEAGEMAAYENRWPVGTMERLAYEIIRCTGFRRGDVHGFGLQHIKNDIYTVRTSNTGQVVTASVLPALRTAIDATSTGEHTLLLTSRGTHFGSKEAFGNWFRKACRAAGVKGSAHGIRKALASEAAELRATEAEMNSFFAWSHGSRERAAHIRKADRVRMADEVSKSLARTIRKGAGKIPNKANDIK